MTDTITLPRSVVSCALHALDLSQGLLASARSIHHITVLEEYKSLRAAIAQQAEQVPDGYQLVPCDETADMQIAFYSKVTVMPQGHILNFSEGYKAMLAAAPKGGV